MSEDPNYQHFRETIECLKHENKQLKSENEEIKHLIDISLIDAAFEARNNVAKLINKYDALYKKYTELLRFQEGITDEENFN